MPWKTVLNMFKWTNSDWQRLNIQQWTDLWNSVLPSEMKKFWSIEQTGACIEYQEKESLILSSETGLSLNLFFRIQHFLNDTNTGVKCRKKESPLTKFRAFKNFVKNMVKLWQHTNGQNLTTSLKKTFLNNLSSQNIRKDLQNVAKRI